MVLGRVHLRDDDLALLAAGAGDEDDAMAVGDGLGHRPARADRLVVGVGMDGHEGGPMRGPGRRRARGSLRCRIIGRCYRGREAARRPSGGRYHRPHARRSPRVPSPACASSTARRSSPGRTARCSSATSAPTSSRSSRPRATRRAAGGRRGSAARPTGRGPRPTTSRSTATSAASGSTSASPDGAAILRRLLGRRRRPRRELPGRRPRPARLRRRGARGAQPAARPSRDHRLRHRRARRPTGPATTSSSRRRAG